MSIIIHRTDLDGLRREVMSNIIIHRTGSTLLMTSFVWLLGAISTYL
jgi:pyrroloquinoline quinone (PQQ) biosynthesis protein C